MLKRLTDYSLRWSPTRRVTVIGIGLACLLALAAATAFLTGRDDHPGTDASDPVPSPAHSSAAPAGQPSSWSGPVAGPPKISDPVQFAKAAAKMLWSYDTRTTSQAQHLTGMRAWMTKEDEYGDWASVAAQIPDPVLWSRMADQEQHATATIAEGHYPAAFKEALAEDPAAITKAYIYAVTVTGKQTITWARGGTGAEDRSVTLAVQCRPSTDCSLVAIAPRVAP
ncbi:hypothetical protein [Streptomyces rubradiris]|uniref:Secreted protein n=1 Tax=Streptomyces rubradiris TaxID=285531 RepID=A0ABQ3RDL9_STRRR|nr:hypothetical protein [Streptomyces rubradiris]GHH29580.1 hypothetical protein GCM10018792_74880 [Streptomyces rubradiris]GHI53952.1 hypothetical protein Srubr_37980 [Streptomyces rubradiris]